MRHVTLTAAAFCLAVNGLSACGGASEPAIAPAAPQTPIEITHRVVAEDSAITVSALQQGKRFTGRFEAFEAEIDFDADDLAGSRVRVRIPLSGLDLGTSDRNDAVPGKVWFNTKLHPVAVFDSESFRRNGEGFVADGTLKMKGLRRPVQLPFTLEPRGDQIVMRGGVEIDRTDWNLGEKPWDTEEWVGHGVQVDVVVVAVPVE